MFRAIVVGIGIGLLAVGSLFGHWTYTGQQQRVAELQWSNTRLAEELALSRRAAGEAQLSAGELAAELTKARQSASLTQAAADDLAAELTKARQGLHESQTITADLLRRYDQSQREAQTARGDVSEMRLANDRLNTRLAEANRKINRARTRADLVHDILLLGAASERGADTSKQQVEITRRLVALDDPGLDKMLKEREVDGGASIEDVVGYLLATLPETLR